MIFKYRVDDSIPQLAWCAKMVRKKDEVKIVCGKSIEKKENWFVEGVWDGEFQTGEFEKSDFLLGSGGKCDGEKVLFATPSHTLERLHFIINNNELYISNSLACVLEMTDSALDLKYLDYEKTFHSILLGIDKYKKDIPLKQKDKKCFVIYYSNILIDNKLNITLQKKKEHSPFLNYKEYEDALFKCVDRITENIKDSSRMKQYDVVTTISSGYDSATCAVIAKRMGSKTAVTFNAPEKYAVDSGAKIAEILGYENIICKNANDYRERKDLVEAEYIAGGELGTGIVFSAFDQEFSGKLVLIGEGGDRIWDRNVQDVNDKVRFSNELYSGSTLLEPRLRLGYFYMPLPFYCATCWPSIYKINQSEEMQPWTLYNTYDRPIARRIIEEAGVPRECFGVEKIGAGFNYRFDTLRRMKGRMSQYSYIDFCNYYLHNRSITFKRIVRIVQYFINAAPAYFNFCLRKLGIKFEINDNRSKNIRVENPLAVSYMFHWGIEKTKERYKGVKS